MGQKHLSLKHEGGLRFVAQTGSGHDVVVDNAAGNTGPRPTELVLAAIAGCTAMDVVEILNKKRQVVDRYSVEVTGTQREKTPNVFTAITILHVVEGDVETEAVRRSIELSATRYCTVSAQIAAGPTAISHRYTIKRPGTDGTPPSEESAEVVVTGPLRDVLDE
ncbi:MAG: OsmC family protein [Candidatus Limnocylindrales bacterium]